MTKLRFSDGVEIETGGDLRIIHLADGLYVTGQGYLYPCRDMKEANEVLIMLKEKTHDNKR